MNNDWRILSSEKLCETPYLRVNRQHVATPSRPDGVTWVVARRHTAAVVAPRTVDGKFIMIRQERIAVQKVLWEFPAGQVDGEVNEKAIYADRIARIRGRSGCYLFERTDCPGLLLFFRRIYRRMLSSFSGEGCRSEG